MNSYIVGLDSPEAVDTSKVGGKGSGLGRLTSFGFDVPNGFVISNDAFEEVLKAAGIDNAVMSQMISSYPATYTNIRSVSARLRDQILHAPFPESLEFELRRKVQELGSKTFVVRSSALDEDGSGNSFAGMNETFTNLSTIEEIKAAITKCWASSFGQRVLAYRAIRRVTMPIAMAVIVQTMIDSRRAGVMFTHDPASGTDRNIVIEASLGQGEVVVGGHVEPDTFVIRCSESRERPECILSSHIGQKEFMITQSEDGSRLWTKLHGAASEEACLSNDEVLDLAHLGLEIERAFGSPQDIEWCIDPAGQVWIVQSRPITTRTAQSDGLLRPPAASAIPLPLLHGLAAAPGVVTAKVRLASSLEDAKSLLPGEVLIAEMTSPDWIFVLNRAAAVVTDRGGITSHAAIVSRELGIPAIVGARVASTTFKTGDLVKVDGDKGTIEKVSTAATPIVTPLSDTTSMTSTTSCELRTKVMVNLSHPGRAVAASQMEGVQGVGLLRAEFLLNQALGGRHPKALIAEGGSDVFVDLLASSIQAIATPFGDRTVVYRSADFRSNEFRLLEGGDRYEPIEENPMIGYRGCFRYIHDPAMFALELEALARVREFVPGLTLMLPFVRTKWELERCIEIIVDEVDASTPHLPVWVMAEVPSILYRLEDYCSLGISGISIGSNDLTQLMLGVDRDSEMCAELFDERDAAVLAAIEDIITRAKSLGMSTSLCGQAPSNHPDFAGELVRMGIDSVSVDPSAVAEVRRNLTLAEAGLNKQENS